MFRGLLSFFFIAFSWLSASAQFLMDAKQPDYFSFSKSYEKKITQDAADLIPGNFSNHPEYAKNPYNSPCENCTELIDRRTEEERYFVQNGTKGQQFFLQKGYGPLHMPDDKGNWITIDSRLSASSESGVFTAENQYFPVKIDMVNHFVSMKAPGQEFKFNTALELQHKDISGTITSLGDADWSNYSAGDDGIKVFNIWPGIDLEIRTMRGKVKTNFIVKEKFLFELGWLIIKDKLDYGDELKPSVPFTKASENNFFDEEISFTDKDKNEYYTISRAFAFDSYAGEQQNYYLNYELKEGNELLIYIPLQWLNSEERVYPVTIDPLVTGTAIVLQTTILAPRWGGSACSVGYGTGCAYPLALPVPVNCTITAILFSFAFDALPPCTRIQGANSMTLGTCTSGPWTCPPPGGNQSGTCGTFDGSGNFVTYDITTEVSACVPAPQCAPYNLNFQLNFFSCNPLNGATCSNSGNNCIVAADNWTMIVQGKTVEVPTITATQSICLGSTATISATANFGVGPYTYAWSPGGMTGSSVTVSPGANTLYTVTATDACAQTNTATSQVNVVANPGFNITPNPVCAGQPVTVNGLPPASGPAVAGNYDWTFPGSTTTSVNNNQNPVVTYNSAGTYNMTLRYAMPGGGYCPLMQTITVTPSNGSPAVSVTANPSGAICPGTSVIFTAAPTANQGTAPTYQWQVNGVNAGSGGTTFTSSSLNNGDVVTVIMTSNAVCVSPLTATSAPIAMSVTSNLVPSVTIAASPAGAICTGTSVTFTATPTNGGTTPTYQWQVNGTNAGTGATFTSASLNTGDVVRVIMTSNASCVSPATATSNTITMTVNPVVTPSVSIVANPSGAICPGTNVTFTATPTNGGVSPTYQWQVNGTNAGTGATFSSTALNNNDAVTVIMTSNANCAVPATATSNSIIVAVSPASVPSVTIAANPSGPICAGTSVTFTAAPTNGGTTPTYQWQVNGTNAGSGGTTFTSATLNNGDDVTVIMTSNATCANPASVTSNTITTVISTNLVPSVTIAASPSGPVCAGINITFTPTPTNGGGAPTYQWQVNGTNVGTSSTYSSATLNNSDVVRVIMTSSATCVSPSTATSNSITMIIFPVVAPSVTIAANPIGSICSGASVTFTPTPTNGGIPTYQWQVNGSNAGTGSTFTSTTLSNGDNVTVIMTSNAACVSPTTATSNTITMSVTPTVTPSVSVSAVPSGQICTGTSVTFTSTPTNGGNTPAYQWQVNGTNAGTGATFTSGALNDNDVVTVILTSNATCASPATATASTTMDVSTTVVPSVTIAAAPSNTICSGTTVSFAASSSGGGSTPTYQWTLNGTNAGTGATFTSSNLNDNDVIEVTMTSSSTCANPQTATSNQVTMSVTQVVTPSVTIADSPSGAQCTGTNITFTPTPVNGGSNPDYQWQLNGANAGTGATYSSSSFNDGDVVSVVLTSDAACATPTTSASNSITVAIDQVLNPSVTVSSVPSGAICMGAQVDFTATPTDAGANPTYQWTVNGTNAGTGTTFSSTALNDGDVVVVTLTSASPCANPTTANSSPVVMDVNTYITPTVSISASPAGPICMGATVTYTAVGANGGSNPVYVWQINGTNTGNGGTTFSPASLNEGDVVTVSLTSSEPCVNGNPAMSNQIAVTLVTPLNVVASNDTTVCSSAPVTLNATASGGDGIYNYTWDNNGGNGSSVSVTPAQTTTYTVTVNDQCGSAPASDDIILTVNQPVPHFSFTPEEANMFDAEIRFENSSQGATDYLWDFGDGITSTDENPVHTYSTSGEYPVTLTITSSGGCVETITYIVTIDDAIAYWVPSAFTPNGDGLNDVFFMSGTYDKPYIMRIYNRLGSEIYFTDNSEPWNGAMFNVGEIVQNGVYVYEIDLDDSDFKGKTLKGRVTVLRDGR